MDSKTNSNFYIIQHQLILFLTEVESRLSCGTHWVLLKRGYFPSVKGYYTKILCHWLHSPYLCVRISQRDVTIKNASLHVTVVKVYVWGCRLSQRCSWGIRSLGMWSHVTVCSMPDFPRQRNGLNFKDRKSKFIQLSSLEVSKHRAPNPQRRDSVSHRKGDLKFKSVFFCR